MLSLIKHCDLGNYSRLISQSDILLQKPHSSSSTLTNACLVSCWTLLSTGFMWTLQQDTEHPRVGGLPHIRALHSFHLAHLTGALTCTLVLYDNIENDICIIEYDISASSLHPGTFSLRPVQARLPSSPRQPPATPWQRAQCIPRPPGPCPGTPSRAPPSSSRSPPSTAHGGKCGASLSYDC